MDIDAFDDDDTPSTLHTLVDETCTLFAEYFGRKKEPEDSVSVSLSRAGVSGKIHRQINQVGRGSGIHLPSWGRDLT